MNIQARFAILTNILLLSISSSLFYSTFLFSNEQWPSNNKIAVSLSYDDALASQLDNALPSLNLRNISASFYVTPLSNGFENRIEDWKKLAKQGHELGNHTLFHACRSDKPGREWVDPFNALEHKTLSDMVNEVKVANTLLKAIDGQSIRTLTPPCFDRIAKNGNYIDAVKHHFIGIKSLEDPNFSALIAPANIQASDIIAFIQSQPKNIRLINVLFHGIGGDHLAITTSEHDKFLDYLVANKQKYWVDTYRNIMLSKSKHTAKINTL